MKASKVIGLIVIARNGDRFSLHQDPYTYAGGQAETTALGEAQSYKLGSFLRQNYLDPASPTFIQDMRFDLVENQEIKTLVKAGVEGTVVFDSAIALLQGLFPPNERNRIQLANSTTIVAPLGGYQYVPVETVEPGNDRSLESWTNCPNFQTHTKAFYESKEFKAKARDAEPFFSSIRDFMFGRPATLENAWNIYDYMNNQLIHNMTYAYRLPPTFINQARHFADFHEDGVFSDKQIDGIGNIAGRTLLHRVVNALEKIAYNGDPLQFMLIETTYQPFISLFHMMDIIKEHPELRGIPEYASAIMIELRRGHPPDLRDFLRIKFKNGTDEKPHDIHAFGHHADIPLTEFIYRVEHATITSNEQWREVCGIKTYFPSAATLARIQDGLTGALGSILLLAVFVLGKFVKIDRVRRPSGTKEAPTEYSREEKPIIV